MVRCLWVVLPGSILWGASFPLALAAVAAPGQDSGPAGRRRLRRQYRRRDHRVRRERTRPGRLARQPHGAAGADLHVGALRADAARACRGRRQRRRASSTGARSFLLVFATGGAGSAGPQRAGAAQDSRRLRPLFRDVGGPEQHHLCRRGLERVGRRVGNGRAASATTTTPARCRRRASRRTCGCSGCSGT